MTDMTEDFEAVDIDGFTRENRYKFLTGSIVPRPIALVTTLGRDGLVNAAPFSQFMILSSTPPILGISCSVHPDGQKDTLRNILDRGEFVINTVNEAMDEITQICAFPFNANVSEVDVLGLRCAPSDVISTPRLTVSHIAFECRLSRTEQFGSVSTLIAGEVVKVHARKNLVSGHRVDHARLQPLGRIAGRAYCLTRDVVDVQTSIDDPYRQFARTAR